MKTSFSRGHRTAMKHVRPMISILDKPGDWPSVRKRISSGARRLEAQAREIERRTHELAVLEETLKARREAESIDKILAAEKATAGVSTLAVASAGKAYLSIIFVLVDDVVGKPRDRVWLAEMLNIALQDPSPAIIKDFSDLDSSDELPMTGGTTGLKRKAVAR